MLPRDGLCFGRVHAVLSLANIHIGQSTTNWLYPTLLSVYTLKIGPMSLFAVPVGALFNMFTPFLAHPVNESK